MADCTTVVVLACQVGLFHLMLTQINSETNFIAKNKCRQSEARHETQKWELECQTRVKTNNMYMFALFVQSLSLIYSMWGKKSIRKSYFHSETVLFCQMFVLLLERDGSVIRSHEDLIRFNNNIPRLARTIYNYPNVLFVFVFFCDTSKASENLNFILNKVLFCRVFVLLL